MTSPIRWQAFDPEGDAPLPVALTGDGAVALVLCGDPSWATRAAVALVRGTAAGTETAAGRESVVVFDTVFEEPRLHGLFGVDAAPGVNDLIRFGASLEHVTCPIDRGVGFVPAGSLVADAAAVRAAPEWDVIIDTLLEAGRTPVLMTSIGAPGADAILARAERIVLLGAPTEVGALGEARERLVGGLHPAGSEAPDTTEAVSERPEGSSRRRRRRKLPPTPQPKRARRGWIVATFALLVLAIAAGTWWFRLVDIPGYGPDRFGLTGGTLPAFDDVAASFRSMVGSAPESADADATRREGALSPADTAAPMQPEPAIAAPLLAWNLEVAVFDEVTPAMEGARGFAAMLPELAFAVTPIEGLDGVLRFHILAGPVGDSVAAQGLRPRLEGSGAVVAPQRPQVRAARLAFVMSETPDLATAERQRAGLELTGMPAHVLALPRVDGSVVYRVYAGAFADESEAAWLAALLARRSSNPPPLAERIGIPPA